MGCLQIDPDKSSCMKYIWIMQFIKKYTIIIFLLASLGATSARAQQTLIKAGKLFDPVQGKILFKREILIDGNGIMAIGEKLEAPANTRIIDLSNYTVLPGLIESHMHLFYSEPFNGNFTEENVKLISMEGDALRTLRALKRARSFLDAGITSVKDLGNSGQYLDVALRNAIREATAEGPRIFAAGPIISSVGGQLPGLLPEFSYLADKEYRIVKNTEDAKLAVREHINYGADLIKICADNSPNNTSLSVEEMRAIVETAHRYNKKVTAHATASRAIYEAIEAGVDGIEHGYNLTDSAARLMAKKNIYFVPTNLSIGDYAKFTGATKEEAAKQLEESQHRILKMAIKAGVKIVAGSDFYTNFGSPRSDAFKNLLLAYYEAGMKPLDIIISCTKTAGEFLNLPNKLGVIKKDAWADIIAIEGDLENDFPHAILQVKFVMKNGKIYKDINQSQK
jgi:imidazolonepropionase-like amidohydrolase